MEQRLVHLASDFIPQQFIVAELFKRILLVSLELIEIDVDAWSLGGSSLSEVSFFQIIVLNLFIDS